MILRENVILDVCPISNVKLQVAGVPTMSEHPIRRLYDKEVICTINSDDPFMFGNTLSEEYYALNYDLSFSRKELIALAQNGFLYADMDPVEREKILSELSALSH